MKVNVDKMTLEIDKDACESMYKNTFVLTMEFMHGDCDGDSNEETEIKDEIFAKYAIAALIEMTDDGKEAYVCLSDDVNLEEITGGWLFEDDSEGWPTEFKDREDVPYIPWPGDSTCDGQRSASLTDWNIMWYDENGTEHAVDYKIKK